MKRRNGLGWVAVYVLIVGFACGDRYVARNGQTPDGAYASWDTAASNIAAAVGVATASETVWVTNGTYYLTNQLVMTSPITLRGFSGDYQDTIINGNYPQYTNRCIYMSHTGAVVEAVTITNGYRICTQNKTWDGGGGVLLRAGTVRNCLITGNTTTNASESGGGGVLVGYDSNLAIVSNCVIRANLSYDRAGGVQVTAAGELWNSRIEFNVARGTMGGGATAYYGGDIYNCQIISNTATVGYGGGVGMREAGSVRNCLIMGNSSPNNGGGLGVWGGGDQFVENCTVVSNFGRGVLKGWWTRPTHFKNNIIYFNTGSQFADSSAGYYTMTNNCIDQAGLEGLTAQGYMLTGTITNDPALVDVAAGNCRLTFASPCLNAGTNLSWFTDATLDLDGQQRIDWLTGKVDIGAYEYIYRGTTIVVQ